MMSAVIIHLSGVSYECMYRAIVLACGAVHITSPTAHTRHPQIFLRDGKPTFLQQRNFDFALPTKLSPIFLLI